MKRKEKRFKKWKIIEEERLKICQQIRVILRLYEAQNTNINK